MCTNCGISTASSIYVHLVRLHLSGNSGNNFHETWYSVLNHFFPLCDKLEIHARRHLNTVAETHFKILKSYILNSPFYKKKTFFCKNKWDFGNINLKSFWDFKYMNKSNNKFWQWVCLVSSWTLRPPFATAVTLSTFVAELWPGRTAPDTPVGRNQTRSVEGVQL